MIVKNQQEITKIYNTFYENLAILYDIKYNKCEVPTTDKYTNLDFMLRQYLKALLLDTDWFTKIPLVINEIYDNQYVMKRFIDEPFTKQSIIEYLTNLNIF